MTGMAAALSAVTYIVHRAKRGESAFQPQISRMALTMPTTHAGDTPQAYSAIRAMPMTPPPAKR